MQRGSKLRLLSLIAALVLVLGHSPSPARTFAKPQWVSSWASAQMLVDAKDALPASNDVTLRQLVRVTTGGTRVRVTVSNAFGTAPLTIAGVHVARAVSPASSRIDRVTDRALTFNGARSVIVPAGAEYVSDPVALAVPALATLAVSMRLAQVPKLQTGHPGSRATSYLLAGNQLSAPDLPGPLTTDHWYFLSGVDVVSAAPTSAVAVLGDSITDGHGVVSNTDTRWPDYLARRLQASPATRSVAVLNLGIGGNRLVDDGLGPNAAARFGRDVLERNGVKYLIILEGVNDLVVLNRDAPASAAGHRLRFGLDRAAAEGLRIGDRPASADQHRIMVERMIGALAQMIARAHEHGIKVIGATILPFGASDYYHPGAATEADRQAVNAWIRSPGHVDAVIDFDALMRDPAHPERMRKELDSDGLHPNGAGYRLMGEAVPLSLFTGTR